MFTCSFPLVQRTSLPGRLHCKRGSITYLQNHFGSLHGKLQPHRTFGWMHQGLCVHKALFKLAILEMISLAPVALVFWLYKQLRVPAEKSKKMSLAQAMLIVSVRHGISLCKPNHLLAVGVLGADICLGRASPDVINKG